MDYNKLEKKLHKTVVGLDNFYLSHSGVWIYGKGLVAEFFEKYLRRNGYEIKGFIVSDSFYVDGDDTHHKASEIIPYIQKQHDGIIIAVKCENIEAVYANCVELGVKNEDILIQHIYNPGFFAFNDKAACISEKSKYGQGFFSDCELDAIGKKHGTDKEYSFNNYLTKYEFFLKQFKNKPLTLIELGVYKGSSLNMWEEYFPKARIIGVDIDISCKRYEEGRKQVLIKDLSNIEDIQSLKEYTPEIIVDDASHLWSHQIMAFSILMPILKNGGGIYFGRYRHQLRYV